MKNHSVPSSSPRNTHTYQSAFARMAGACLLLATLASGGFANAAIEPSPPSATTRFCEAAVGKAADGKVPPPIIFNRFKRDGAMMRLEGRVDKENKLAGARPVEVSSEEAKALCDMGFPVDVLFVGEPSKAGVLAKTVVQPVATLPTEISITYGLVFGTWTHYGNFWVPATMPAGHTFQVLDFTVTGDNYQNSGADSHFGAMTQAFSNSNFDTDFDAKGAAIFAGGNGWCAAGANVMLQSWAIQNFDPTTSSCGAYAGCSTPVYGNQYPSTPPYTANRCTTWNPTTSKRFKVGSNIWQQSVYWMCQVGGACPGEFTSDVADSSTPYYRLGGAGVAFVHVSTAPSFWSLSFTSVSSFTSP